MQSIIQSIRSEITQFFAVVSSHSFSCFSPLMSALCPFGVCAKTAFEMLERKIGDLEENLANSNSDIMPS